MNSPERVISRAPRPLVLAMRGDKVGLLGRKPVSKTEGEHRINAIVGQIADSDEPLTQDQADMISKVLDRHHKRIQANTDG